MDNANYSETLKNKKIELIDSLNLLGKTVASKVKEKNKTIDELNKKLQNTDLDYIAKYKSEKNKEFNSLKSELNSILADIDNIINDITI